MRVPLSMNLDEKAPSPRPSPAEREREKGRQRVGNAAKFTGSMRKLLFRRNLSPLRRAVAGHPTIANGWVKKRNARRSSRLRPPAQLFLLANRLHAKRIVRRFAACG